MGGAGCESADDCTDNFKTIFAKEGIHHLLSGNKKVPLPSSIGKTVCLLFSANWSRPCNAFIPQLVELYNTLKNTHKELEIIFISLDRDENGYKEHTNHMPWLVVPYDTNLQKMVSNFYKINQIPSFIPLGVDTNLLARDIVGLIKDYGSDAFPFTEKRHEELKALDESKRRGGKLDELFGKGLENILVSGEGKKVKTSELVGKTIGLYFGAHWCPPSRGFTTQLIETYTNIISDKNKRFEIIFISTDRDLNEFKLSLSTMPWLAVPFNNKTQQDLCRIFDIKWIPTLIFFGPDGKTVSANGRAMVSLYGSRAYPFSEPKVLEVEAELIKEGEGLVGEVKDCKHEHVLKRDFVKGYICDFCKKRGTFWAFTCGGCGYDLHPGCIEEKG